MVQNDAEEKDLQLAKIFIERTQKALRQYEENLKEGQQSYAHTLFINACVGFLMVAMDSIYDDFPMCGINKDWGILPQEIEIKGNDKSVRNVVSKIRNAIGHFNFSFAYGKDNESLPIKEISFQNWDNELRIKDLSFESFKKFVNKVADTTIEIINKRLSE